MPRSRHARSETACRNHPANARQAAVARMVKHPQASDDRAPHARDWEALLENNRPAVDNAVRSESAYPGLASVRGVFRPAAQRAIVFRSVRSSGSEIALSSRPAVSPCRAMCSVSASWKVAGSFHDRDRGLGNSTIGRGLRPGLDGWTWDSLIAFFRKGLRVKLI